MKFSASQTKAIQKTALKTRDMFKAMAASQMAAPIIEKLGEFISSLSPLSPLMPIYSSWFGAIAGFITAENAENIKTLADALFSEETIESIKRFAEFSEPFCEALADMTVGVIGWVNDMSKGIEDFDKMASQEIEEGFFSLKWAEDFQKGMRELLGIAEKPEPITLESGELYRPSGFATTQEIYEQNIALKEARDELLEGLTGWAYKLAAGFEHMQEGGDILQSGLKYLHKKETVLSAGKGEEITSLLKELIESNKAILYEKEFRHR